MDAFFFWLEATRLSVWTRESPSIFAFPGILAAHAIGMGLAVGVNAAVALRLLGAAPGVPVGEMRRFFPYMWFGFWVNAASGVLLLIAYPTKALTNPLFYVKLLLIAIAMTIFVVLKRRLLEPPRSLRALSLAALVCWAGAIASGRFLAYTYTRLFADR
jgi:hypothetical protein